MPDGVKQFKKNKGKMGEVVVMPEDEKTIIDVYWAGRDCASNFTTRIKARARRPGR